MVKFIWKCLQRDLEIMFKVVYMLDIAKLEHFPPSRLDRIFLLHHIVLNAKLLR